MAKPPAESKLKMAGQPVVPTIIQTLALQVGLRSQSAGVEGAAGLGLGLKQLGFVVLGDFRV